MNKNGFTLIEVLSVVVLLSMLVVAVATNGFEVFNKAKGKIDEENIKAIEEAANVLMVDVKFCSDDFNDYDTLVSYFIGVNANNCSELQNVVKGKNIDFNKFKKDYLIGNNLESITNEDVTIKVKNDSLEIEVIVK